MTKKYPDIMSTTKNGNVLALQNIANELAEANRLKRVEIRMLLESKDVIYAKFFGGPMPRKTSGVKRRVI